MDTAKYADLFLTESREHLANINQSLLALEGAPPGTEGTEARARAVDALFRGAHTIKGMSATMGYTLVADRSHQLETLLEGIRRGRQAVTPEIIDEMLRAADALEHEVEAAVAAVEEASDMPTDATPLAASVAVHERSIRVDLRRLDTLMNLTGELVIARGRLEQLAAAANNADLTDVVGQTARLVGDLQNEIMTSRMVPVGQVFDRFPRVVRDTARSLGKEVAFTMEGRDIELDRSMLDEIGDPIVHLLRNAIDHGIELPDARRAAGKASTGRLTLSALRDRSVVLIRVTDDGRGIDRDRVLRKAQDLQMIDRAATTLSDEDLVRVIARPGFSTADAVTSVSGRGVGIDAVMTRVHALGGTVEIQTAPGTGTTVTARLPLTLAIARAVLARVGDETYAVPMVHVDETVARDEAQVATIQGRPMLVLREHVMPLLRLREIVGLPPAPDAEAHVLVVESGGRRAAIAVDELTAEQEIVVKQVDPIRGSTIPFSGVTVLGNGAPALIVDIGTFL